MAGYEGRLTAVVETKGAKSSAEELDKFSKSATNAEKSSLGLAGTLKKGGVAFATIATAGAALAATIGGLTAKIAQDEDKLADLARVAGITTKQFKELTFAYGAFGVSAESVTETSRKVLKEFGQFQATGAGGFRDVLDTLKGKSDLTAESLRGLSGTDVLQKLKNELDAANVPLEQQQFLLDGVARGAGALIPILGDGGKEIAGLTEKYRLYNDQLALTADQSQAFGAIADDIDLLSTTISNAGKYLAAEFAPELQSAINWALENVPKATQAMESFFGQFRDVEDIGNTNTLLEKQADNLKTIEAMQAKIRAGTAGTRVYETLEAALLENSAIEYKIELLKEKAKIEAAPVNRSTGSFVDIDARRKAEETASKAAQKAAEDAEKLRQDMAEIAADEVYLINELDVERQKSRDKEKEIYASRVESAYDFLDQIAQLGVDQLTLIDIQERQRLDKLLEYSNEGLIQFADFEEAKTRIHQQASDEREAYELAKQRAIFTGAEQFFGAMVDLTAQFGSDQSNLYKAMFAFQKAAAIASSIIAIQEGIAKASSLQFPANLAAMATVASNTAGIVSAISGTGLPARQQGGQMRAGQSYLVGEKGPEMIQMGMSGRIANNGETSGMSAPTNVDVTVINQASGVKVDTQKQDDGRIVMIVRHVMEAELMNPNSQANKALNKTRNASRKFS